MSDEARGAAFEKLRNRYLDADMGGFVPPELTVPLDAVCKWWFDNAWQAATEAQRERDAKIAEAAEPKDQLEELSWNRGH